MAVPVGAISNTALSLVGAIQKPTASNVVGAITNSVSIANNPGANKLAQGAAPLLTSAVTALGGGAPFDTINGINQAVKLASGFMDPKTAAIAGSVSSGINALFGANGLFNPMSPRGPGGNKPIALHTETMAAQPMKSAYSEGQDVVFSFVRMGSTLEEDIFSGFGDGFDDFGSAIGAGQELNFNSGVDLPSNDVNGVWSSDPDPNLVAPFNTGFSL